MFFISGFPSRTSYVRWKNILKSPLSIMFLQCKLVISPKRSQGVDRVFSCSDSLLALYRLISKKSLSLTFSSKILILPGPSGFLFETSKLVLPMKPVATPQELLWPCEKKSFPVNSSFHFSASCMVECVSCKKINPQEAKFLFNYSKNFIPFSND